MKLTEVSRNDAKLILLEGITHIDDQSIPIDRFIDILKNLKEYEITEKVDGANLKFGLTFDGRFFTSRMGKGGNEYFDQDDWGSDFKDTGFKSAHAALKSKISDIKKAGLNPGDIVEIEVLFGNKPNTIPYWPNQIIFLRPIQGEPDIEKISDALDGQKVQVKVDSVPSTDDGETIQYHDEIHTWTFSKVKKYDVDIDQLEQALSDSIDEIEKFLHSPNIANFKMVDENGIEKIPSNIEVLALRTTQKNKEAKELIKDVIDGTRDKTTGKRITKAGLRFKVKEILLDKLVRMARSSIGPKIEDGGWIEGVVLRRPTKDGDELIKVVDKDIFTAVNEFNHQVRNFITAKHKGRDTPRESAGILGNLLRDMAETIGHPVLGTSQAKRYIEKYGSTKNQILSNLARDVSLSDTKIKWLKLLDKAERLLKSTLNQYKNQVDRKVYVDSIGRAHKYDTEINKRTLQTFAALFRDITKWKSEVSSANSVEELLMILIGDKI